MKERLTARVVLVNNENKILLLKMNTGNGVFWITPGGGIKHNETPLETAKRELFEESGIINAEFVTPHRWYLEHKGHCYGEPTLFKEHIFLAYTNETIITLDNLEADEQNCVLGLEWCDIIALKERIEGIQPDDIVDIFDSILCSNNIGLNQHKTKTTV